jgi:hypothetical protein
VKPLFLCALVAAAALSVQSAKADTFSISFDGGSLGYSGSGIFVGSETSPGVFDLTSVLGGSVTDPGFGTSSIVSLSDYAGSDNTLTYPNGGQYFDLNGLAFTLANGVSINLFDYVAGSELFEGALESNPNGDISEFVTESVGPVPEPSTFVLVGTSILGAAGLFRRRFLA